MAKPDQAAALLARIDERTLHMAAQIQTVAKAVEKVDGDVNGIGQRLSHTENAVESHRWALRLLAATLLTAIITAVLKVLTA